MENILSWGLNLIHIIQSIRTPFLDTLFKIITMAGSEGFFLVTLILIFWCIDRKKGIYLIIIFLFSNFINQFLKILFAQPRPFEADPSVKIIDETGYGLPSGHSQNSIVYWGIIGSWIKKGWILTFVAALLIGFSRIYLGVHYPTDVFTGWTIGLLILLFSLFFGEKLENILIRLKLPFKLLISVFISLLILVLHPGDTATPGVLLGVLVGYTLMSHYFPFSAKGKIIKKTLRYLVGFIGVVLLYFGLKTVFPNEGESGYHLFRFIRYCFLGFWGTFGAPWLFIKLKLAEKDMNPLG